MQHTFLLLLSLESSDRVVAFFGVLRRIGPGAAVYCPRWRELVLVKSWPYLDNTR